MTADNVDEGQADGGPKTSVQLLNDLLLVLDHKEGAGSCPAHNAWPYNDQQQCLHHARHKSLVKLSVDCGVKLVSSAASLESEASNAMSRWKVKAAFLLTVAALTLQPTMLRGSHIEASATRHTQDAKSRQLRVLTLVFFSPPCGRPKQQTWHSKKLWVWQVSSEGLKPPSSKHTLRM